MSRQSWPVPVLWPDETVVILAGGPSLTMADVRYVALRQLEEACRVIAVNDSSFLAWWADWLHACDRKWWDWHRNTATKFPGIRSTCDETVPDAWAHYIGVQPPDKLSGWCAGYAEAQDELAAGGNGGYQAIQIAAKGGARKVILLGFDMRSAGGDATRAHWFGDHPDGVRNDFERLATNFETLVEPLQQRGVEVLNATPGSNVTCFSMAKLEDVL